MGQVRAYAATHTGAVRANNEDAFVINSNAGLWAVADGAGGHEAGEVASTLITDALGAIPWALTGEELLSDVRSRIGTAHSELRKQAAQNPRSIIASTVVILLIRDDRYGCLWAGDSRGYLLRDGNLNQITRDHSLVQEMLDRNQITLEMAESHPRANVITRAVGSNTKAVELDKVAGVIEDGDKFLLCSDGLYRALSANEILEILNGQDPERIPDQLIAAALDRQAADNVTAMLIVAAPR